jgi:hypothetical protein
MTDKKCNKYIKPAFEAKKLKAQSHSLSDSDDDKENSMPKQSLAKKEQLQAIANNPTRSRNYPSSQGIYKMTTMRPMTMLQANKRQTQWQP